MTLAELRHVLKVLGFPKHISVEVHRHNYEEIIEPLRNEVAGVVVTTDTVTNPTVMYAGCVIEFKILEVKLSKV